MPKYDILRMLLWHLVMRYQYKQAKVMYQGVEISLFFSRQGKGGKWEVLLTADTCDRFEEKY